MAEFSKQYLEKNDQGNVKPSIDIDLIGEGLVHDQWTSAKCDGYGFIGIAKLNGNLLLAMPTGGYEEGDPLVQWFPYSDIVK